MGTGKAITSDTRKIEQPLQIGCLGEPRSLHLASSKLNKPSKHSRATRSGLIIMFSIASHGRPGFFRATI